MAIIKNKGVVVITGASAGLGRCCARTFAQRGYDVALIARGRDGLQAAKEEVDAYGRKSAWYALDVADADAVEATADRIEKELGPIRIWVNNAMVSVFSPVKQMQAEEYKRVTEVTYLGQVYGALAALKCMRSRNCGSIVFVGSALAYRGIPLQSAYCASKHAIQGFYDSLRTELMHDKSHIAISMVELPAMNTTQFGFVRSRLPNKPRPMGSIYQPDIAADSIVYAAEHKRREILLGFSTIKAVIGNKIAPWYADWVLSRNGFKGQQTNEPEKQNRADNLWKPLKGDHGIYGDFTDKAKKFSLLWWMDKNRTGTFILLVSVLILAGFIIVKL